MLNEQGELIGIHGRAESIARPQNSKLQENVYVLKTEFNYAISINAFLSLALQIDKTLALRLPPSPSVSSAPKGDDFFLKADEQLKKANYKGAIALLDQAIRLNPKDAGAYAARGFVRDDLGDKQGAIADLLKAAALFKAQGDEHNRQNSLKKIQQIKSR